MNAATLTTAMKRALKWFRNRGGDGVFAEKSNNSVLLACGDRAPIMRGTWSKLEAAGCVERYGVKRLRVTSTGAAVDLSAVRESTP
jgi:hypothetical protein